MPRSKKPRKQHVPKRVRRYLPVKAIHRIRESFLDVQIAVEMKLHLGTCTKRELEAVIDMFNLAGLSALSRGKTLSDEDMQLIRAGAYSLSSLKARADATGKVVCTANELDGIRDGLEAVGRYLESATASDAERLLIEWRALQLYEEDV